MGNDYNIDEEIIDPRQRSLKKVAFIVGGSIAFLYALFHFYTAAFGPFSNIIQRSIHVLFAMVMVFIFYKPSLKSKSQSINIYDIIFASFLVFSSIYLIVNYNSIMTSSASSTMVQVIIGWTTIILLLEASRRVMGIIFPILALIAILYGFFGPYMPGIWRHNGIDYKFMIEHLYLGTQGLWGITTSVTATTVAIFIIFGVILMKSGAADFFMKLSLILAGRTTGGPAKVAVLASTFFSMLSGSAPANVAVTGNITIPMMTNLKYDRNFAGAVEATASTGGQMTPPIMGAGAFLMAEMIGIPYTEVVIAAIIPAFLFYVSVFFSVHWKSAALGYKPLKKSEIPTLKETFKLSNVIITILPVTVLLINLFGGTSAAKSGFIATVVCIVLFLLRDLNVSRFKNRFSNLIKMFIEAGTGLILIAVLAGTAQIIVGLISLTGLGIKLSNFILSMSGGFSLLTLFLAMVVCIILGMGMPTTAAYLLAASTLAPTLIMLGFAPLASHLFVFYFAVVSAITPPVCAAVFVACGISKGDWLKTASLSCLIGFPAFIVPFIFIHQESFLMQGDVSTIVVTVITACIGIYLISGGLMGNFFGNLNFISRIVLMVSGMLLLLPGTMTNYFGAVLAIVFLMSKKFIIKNMNLKRTKLIKSTSNEN
ncbi:TRAP transporter permease [Sporosarcina sp. FA9]|uniref:TRAP transporter permease n=1 Tax=Sporosarcina sp. FA9 TaxID=3413030 RepID=UPI003F654C0B